MKLEAPIALERAGCERCGVPVMWTGGRGRAIPFDLTPEPVLEARQGGGWDVYGIVHWFTCAGLYTVAEGRALLGRLS